MSVIEPICTDVTGDSVAASSLTIAHSNNLLPQWEKDFPRGHSSWGFVSKSIAFSNGFIQKQVYFPALPRGNIAYSSQSFFFSRVGTYSSVT